MIKIKLRNPNKTECDFIYRWAFECAGKGFDIGVSYTDYQAAKEKCQTILRILKGRTTQPKTVKSDDSHRRTEPLGESHKVSSTTREKTLST